MRAKGLSQKCSWALLVLGLISTCVDGQADPVKVTVFVETLCPDSMAFVSKQLGPTWESLREIMVVDFNAYGFVELTCSHKETPVGEGYDFSCQHGAEECQGNMVVECARRYIDNSDTFVDFSVCLMSSSFPPGEGENCAATVGAAWSPIDACANSVEGQQLLHDSGVRQNSLDPVPDYIPWIIINDVFTQEHLDEAQTDLTGLVCRTYEGTPPPVCQL